MDKVRILTNNAIGAFTNPVQFLKFRYKATPAQLGEKKETKENTYVIINLQKKTVQLQN
jgi:hypothetical protein